MVIVPITNGYKTFYHIISADFLQSLYPNETVSYFGFGGELISDGTAATVYISDVEVYELESGISIHNYGFSGDDTVEGLARIDALCRCNPNVCVIAFGTNDIHQNGITITKEQYLDNITAMAIKLIEYGATPIFATIPPLATSEAHYDQVEDWNKGIRERANVLRIGVWDRWSALNQGDLSYLADGRHPTVDGYHLLATSLMSVLLGRLIQ